MNIFTDSQVFIVLQRAARCTKAPAMSRVGGRAELQLDEHSSDVFTTTGTYLHIHRYLHQRMMKA